MKLTTYRQQRIRARYEKLAAEGPTALQLTYRINSTAAGELIDCGEKLWVQKQSLHAAFRASRCREEIAARMAAEAQSKQQEARNPTKAEERAEAARIRKEQVNKSVEEKKQRTDKSATEQNKNNEKEAAIKNGVTNTWHTLKDSRKNCIRKGQPS